MGDSAGDDRATVVEPRRADQPVDLATGALLDRYVVLDRLGAGGMGIVYAAYDPDLDRKVAVKLLGTEAQPGSEGHARMLREAQAMAALTHPNVAAVYDVGTLDGKVFLAMELLDGSLAPWLKQDRAWRDIVARFVEAARGLAAAHDANIVHRDFKPDNVLLTKDGTAKVTDFGLARVEASWEKTPTPRAGMLNSQLTVTGALMGTPKFMAPEQWRREAIDARADQFAFCVSLYMALYRQDPYASTGETRLDEIVANRVREPPATTKVPVWIHRAIVRGLRAEPAERWPSMRALIGELERDPAAKRRRFAIGAVVVAVLGGAVGMTLVMASDRPQPCAGADANLVGVWDAPARAAVDKAFAKSKYALASTETALDDYAHDWVAMRTEACVATRVRGDQADDVLALRDDCLDTRLVEMRALVHALASADDKLILRSVDAVQSLSPLADCADVARLRAPDHLPTDPAARAKVVELRAKIAEGRGLQQAGHYKEALALAQRAAGDATTLGHHPTEAEALVVEGEVESILSQRDAADKHLLDAVIAAEAGKADGPRLEAWIHLTREAVRASKLDLASERARLARAVLDRLGDPFRDKADLLRVIIDLQSEKGAMDDALATAHELRTLVEQNQGTDTLDYANALGMEAAVLTDSGRRVEGLELHQKVFALRVAQLGPDHPSVAISLDNLASVETDLGHYEDGVTHSKRAIAIREAAFGADSPDVAQSLNQLASALTGLRDYAGSLAALQRAETIVVHTLGDDDLQHAFLLANIGIIRLQLKHPADAVPDLERAVAIATQRLGADNQQTGAILGVQCTVQLEAGQVDAAIATGKRALAIEEAALGKSSPLLFDPLVALASAQLAAKHPADALGLLERALAAPSGDPIAQHAAEFTAARAAWDAGARPHALELARAARDGYRKLGARWNVERDEVDAWLKQHVVG